MVSLNAQTQATGTAYFYGTACTTNRERDLYQLVDTDEMEINRQITHLVTRCLPQARVIALVDLCLIQL